MNEAEAHEMKIVNIDDFNRLNPGKIKSIFEWFRTIKTYDGKPENRFGR